MSERCDPSDAVLDPDFVGWYLRVTSVVYGPDTEFAMPGKTTTFGPWPYSEPVWQRGPTTAVSIVARIGSATGPRAASCGPPPLVQGLPPRVAVRVRFAHLDPDGTARVECFGACTVVLHASDRGSYVAARWSVGDAGQGMRIAPSKLTRLGHGPTLYTLFIDGHRAAQETIRR
jgi:hypothetical protein